MNEDREKENYDIPSGAKAMARRTHTPPIHWSWVRFLRSVALI